LTKHSITDFFVINSLSKTLHRRIATNILYRLRKTETFLSLNYSNSIIIMQNTDFINCHSQSTLYSFADGKI